MPRIPRPIARSGCYHVVQRGNGQQIIFENPSDYQHFIDLLTQYKASLDFKILAYCLMENHYHLLIQTKQNLGYIMQILNKAYSVYYNSKYERIGHVFQGRYHSEIIDDQTYFFNVIQYIHLNPEKSHLCTAKDYHWSSYRDYLHTPKLADPSLLYTLVGGKSGFLTLMARNLEVQCLDIDLKPIMNDEAALTIIKTKLGLTTGTQLLSMNRTDRNNGFKLLKEAGLSTRQIARLTGISKSLVAKI